MKQLNSSGRVWARSMVCLAICLILSGVGPAESVSAETPQQKKVELTFSDLQNAQDRASAEISPGKAIIRVSSPRGIGHMDVSARRGTWPEQVTLVLEKFNELEHFQLSCGRMYLQGSRKSSGKFELFFLPDDRDFNHRSEIGSANVRVEVRPEGVVVIFPGLLFADAEKVHFSWIDWLRG